MLKLLLNSSLSGNHEFMGYFFNENQEYILVFYKVKYCI